ncbi:MAG: DUF2202 domain-containing protein [Saprospiraceae bacterium]|nr:DUF2202 domain-containing protein [Saprospiraceae bacterium]
MKNIIVTLLLLLVWAMGTISAQDNNSYTIDEDLSHYYAMVDLTADVNTGLNTAWQLPIFEKITNSENRMIVLISERMRIMNIAENEAILKESGVYADKGLQKLYDKLIPQGAESLNNALLAAAELEENQLLFLEKALERTENLDVILLYDQLRMISKKNLRSIAAQLQNEGVTYRPIVMSDEYFENQVMSDRGPIF